jgi:hypothetical protein
MWFGILYLMEPNILRMKIELAGVVERDSTLEGIRSSFNPGSSQPGRLGALLRVWAGWNRKAV